MLYYLPLPVSLSIVPSGLGSGSGGTLISQLMILTNADLTARCTIVKSSLQIRCSECQSRGAALLSSPLRSPLPSLVDKPHSHQKQQHHDLTSLTPLPSPPGPLHFHPLHHPCSFCNPSSSPLSSFCLRLACSSRSRSLSVFLVPFCGCGCAKARRLCVSLSVLWLILCHSLPYLICRLVLIHASLYAPSKINQAH